MRKKKERYICDECYDCACFISNDDTGSIECPGQGKPCHEYRLDPYKEHLYLSLKQKTSEE